MKNGKEKIMRITVLYGVIVLALALVAGSVTLSVIGCSKKMTSEPGMKTGTTTSTGGSTVSGKAEYTLFAATPAPAFKDAARYAPPARTQFFNTEEYAYINENGFKSPLRDPLSTFSIDVDTASYSNVRRFLTDGTMPPPDAVRIEELVNYFSYDYPQPTGQDPFSITMEMSQCPWNWNNMLVHVGLQGKNLNYGDVKPSNFVFLLDVSGSMSSKNKLPLVKKSLEMLLQELGPNDRIAIVAYAGAAGLVLPSTPASHERTIMKALDNLSAGGSTAGGQGIELAYRVAWENLIPDGNNRVILCTDGDFNVGMSSTGDLVRMIEDKRQHGVYLTICGFGMGNYKDDKMESLSNAGNGNFFYIDDKSEARKVFVHEMRANMFTLAKDVKIQVEFNPAKVKEYRLVGYENRILAAEDFNNDLKDAGEIGPGHTVTALYEIVPTGLGEGVQRIDSLKYQKSEPTEPAYDGNEILNIKFRYKNPKEDHSQLISRVLEDTPRVFAETSNNFRFSAAVAGWGMLLRQSPYAERLTWGQIERMAQEAKGSDEMGYRTEFIELINTSKNINS
ncbi:MAG: VWA domain-containing protein [Desulfatibacillum sp.]|nr:VWA domain-containing protein [Desulfatibacillum sp.]